MYGSCLKAGIGPPCPGITFGGRVDAPSPTRRSRLNSETDAGIGCLAIDFEGTFELTKPRDLSVKIRSRRLADRHLRHHPSSVNCRLPGSWSLIYGSLRR